LRQCDIRMLSKCACDKNVSYQDNNLSLSVYGNFCCGGGRRPPSPSALGSSAAIGRSYNRSGTTS